jgi:signal transduction histidine kinase
MKEFSHPGNGGKQAVDLNHVISGAVTLCHSEWKYVAEVITDFDAELPAVPCIPTDINSVMLNLVVNAAHAIAEATSNGANGKGRITIHTRLDGPYAEIRVEDTGPGIADDIRSRVFGLFFTTKEVGRGTGQGLSLARAIVVDKHGGTIDFETEVGRGTTFIVRLPIDGCAPSPAATADAADLSVGAAMASVGAAVELPHPDSGMAVQLPAQQAHGV